MLSEHWDGAAGTAFFARAIGNNGFPDRVVIDQKRCKSGRAAEHELPAIIERLVLDDRSLAGQISEQFDRAGPPVHQETDEANEGI